MSETAATGNPMDESFFAATEPTWPNPWMTTEVVSGSRFISWAACAAHAATPHPVASKPPREPPSSAGLSLMAAGQCIPVICSYSSSIQAMACFPVPISAPGMSVKAPFGFSLRTKPRISRSYSPSLRADGSALMPPFPPPAGMSATPCLMLIKRDNAFISSGVSPGRTLVPSFVGPVASWWHDRKARNSFRAPLSIRTGMVNSVNRMGTERRSRISGSSFMASAAFDRLNSASSQTFFMWFPPRDAPGRRERRRAGPAPAALTPPADSGPRKTGYFAIFFSASSSSFTRVSRTSLP